MGSDAKVFDAWRRYFSLSAVIQLVWINFRLSKLFLADLSVNYVLTEFDLRNIFCC